MEKGKTAAETIPGFSEFLDGLTDHLQKADPEGFAKMVADVEAALGPGHVICDQCGATLDTYADKCSAPLEVQCPGFLTVEAARLSTSSPAAGR